MRFGRSGAKVDAVLGNDPGIDNGTGGPVEMGETYVDAITGFEGVATARFVYLYGCVRVLLEGGGDPKDPKEMVVDEQRLTTTGGLPVAITATSGGPRATPARHTRG